ncbi:MAG: hypothetical protein ABSC23_09120 [Bryobacteraceae bacterium]|jgi:hypothetical protein
MTSFCFRREFPEPSLATFVALQALDALTTILGLRVGAKEASVFVGRLIQLSPVAGLVLSKVFALILATAAFGFRRPRIIVFLNLWFAAVVTWNLAMILLVQLFMGA